MVEIQHQGLLPRERLANGLGGHIRVVVHVAPGPGPEPHHRGQMQRIGNRGKGILHRIRKLLVKRRDDAVQDVGQEKQDVFRLVAHAHVFPWVFLGLPACGDVHSYAGHQGLLFLGREVGVEHLDQVPGDALLVSQHCAARHFHWVRGEDGLHRQSRQRRKDRIGTDAAVLESRNDVFESARLGCCRVPQVGPAPADPVDLLGQVDDLEVGGKRANEFSGGFRGQRSQQSLELFQRLGIAFPVGDGCPAR